jgi:hypothetical protein
MHEKIDNVLWIGRLPVRAARQLETVPKTVWAGREWKKVSCSMQLWYYDDKSYYIFKHVKRRVVTRIMTGLISLPNKKHVKPLWRWGRAVPEAAGRRRS